MMQLPRTRYISIARGSCIQFLNAIFIYVYGTQTSPKWQIQPIQ